MASPTRSLKLFAVGVLDRLGSLLGRPPRYIPAGVAPGEFGAVAEHDTIAPVGPALRVAERAPKAELFRSRGDHYDVYEGGEDYDRVINAEVEIPASASTGSRPVTPAGAAQSRTSGGARRSGP
jgi:hypothetical protein